MAINIIYLIGLQILDFVITDIFQLGFIGHALCFIPLMTFVGFEFMVNELKLEQALIWAIVFGFIQDFLMYNGMFELVYIYIIVTLLGHFWSKYLNDNFFSSMILALILIFSREVLTYVFRYYRGLINFSFGYFVSHRLIIVMIFNMVLVALVFLLNSFRVRAIIRSEYNRRMSEDLFGVKIDK